MVIFLKATPVYLSEVAPPKWRGAFNIGFEFFLGVGVVTANCINFATSRLSWGWRLSLALAAVPAIVMTIGSVLISDTPSSLVQRGKLEQAKESLAKVRGKDANIEHELEQIINSNEVTKTINQKAFKTIFEIKYRPHLVMSIAIPSFQQLTGINIIAFYAPVLFQSMNFGDDGALIGTIILGSVNLASILISSVIVDRFGRRFLLIVGGLQILLCQV